MQVLVLYSILTQMRKTVHDHLYSFDKYLAGNCYYHNLVGPLPKYLFLLDYDVIVLHYTLLSYRSDEQVLAEFLPWLREIKKLKGVKVALPQDEYIDSAKLSRLCKELAVELMFSLASEEMARIFYPKELSGIDKFFQVLPGYVEEDNLKIAEEVRKEQLTRDIDIGYRARSLPFNLGKHAQLKKEIENRLFAFKDVVPLKMDISTDPKEVFYGNEWMRFLCRSRTTPTCLGGASLHDPEGKIRHSVATYLQSYPEASFEEVEKACFPGLDYLEPYPTMSPRCFEAAMAGSTLLIVEGDHGGMFQDGVNCIEIKKDFSNLEKVLELVSDEAYCEKIAKRAYEDLILSGKYSYKAFASHVIEKAIESRELVKKRFFRSLLVRFLCFINEKLNPIKPYIFFRLKRIRPKRFVKNRLKKLKEKLAF